jgi:hypothetical protein
LTACGGRHTLGLMNVFLITYDLKDSTKEDALLAYIKDFKRGWIQVAESSYAVKTAKSATQIVAKIRELTGSKIRVYVLSISKPYDGYDSKPGRSVLVNEWLEENLR